MEQHTEAFMSTRFVHWELGLKHSEAALTERVHRLHIEGEVIPHERVGCLQAALQEFVQRSTTKATEETMNNLRCRVIVGSATRQTMTFGTDGNQLAARRVDHVDDGLQINTINEHNVHCFAATFGVDDIGQYATEQGLKARG